MSCNLTNYTFTHAPSACENIDACLCHVSFHLVSFIIESTTDERASDKVKTEVATTDEITTTHTKYTSMLAVQSTLPTSGYPMLYNYIFAQNSEAQC